MKINISTKRQFCLVLVVFAVIGFGAGIFTTRYFSNTDNLEDKYAKQETIIDKLQQQLERSRAQSDSLITVARQSDSISQSYDHILNKSFNDDEKKKRITAITALNDSASLRYFSKWLSKIDTLQR